MKRFLVSTVLLVSAFACTGSAEGPNAPVAGETIELDSTPVLADVKSDLSEDAAEAADDLVHTVPTGSFANVDSFCVAQKKLVAQKIVEANESFRSDGFGDMNLAADCKETPDVLATAKVSLEAPFLEAKAVTFETGYSVESYLLVRTADGWSAVRSALVYANHNDPGCGSIERPTAISDVHVEHGALVVKTDANRSSYTEEGTGDVFLTYARACRIAPNGVACGTPEVTDAKLVLRDLENELEGAEAPTRTRFFSTTFTVGGGVMIHPAQRFDESTL